MSERVLFAKMTQVRRHLARVRDRLPEDEKAFLSDQDLQDVVVHNLWLALQGCIDIAAHVVSDEGFGQPSGLGEVFDILGEHGVIAPDLASALRKAAGLRNIIVHEYVKLDLALLFRLARENLKDLDAFLFSVADRFALPQDESA